LNLVALPESGQRALILRHDTSQRNREIVSQREVGVAARFVLSALQGLEGEPVALLAVRPKQRRDVIERRGLDRIEAVPHVHLPYDPNDIFTTADVVRQEVAGAAWRLSRSG